MESKSTWEKYSEEKIEACYKFCEGYKDFLSNCKTEQECVKTISPHNSKPRNSRRVRASKEHRTKRKERPQRSRGRGLRGIPPV